MSDEPGFDPVKAACMADLSRSRQEELPLSHEEKRGPSYAPGGRDDSINYTMHRKFQLKGKWNATFDDEESKQMVGLKDLDARPWACKEAKRVLKTFEPKSSQPPSLTSGRSASCVKPVGPAPSSTSDRSVSFVKPVDPAASSESQSVEGYKAFKPTTPGWEPTVQGLISDSEANSLTLPKRRGQLASAAPTATSQQPSSMKGTSAKEIVSSSTATGSSHTRLTFIVNKARPADNDLEYVAGSGHCHIVPGKNKALSYVTKLTIKMKLRENKAILELCSDSKRDKIHNALDIEKPILDGEYCVVKAASVQWPYYLHFDTTEEAQNFKSCLSRVRKAVRMHQKPEETGRPLNNTANSAEGKPETVESMAPDTHAPADHHTKADTAGIKAFKSTENTEQTTDAGAVHSGVAESPASSTFEHPETLISMDEGWGLVENHRVPDVDETSKHVIALVKKVISHISSERSFGADEIAGINDAIFEKWMSEGFLRGSNEHLKQEFMKAIRSLVSLHFSLYSHFTGALNPVEAEGAHHSSPKTSSKDNEPQTQTVVFQNPKTSVTFSEHKVTKGLSSSRFATREVAFSGSFTGPRKNYW
ncbi:hypothetical protein FGRMN_1115 [Fusarium graminum]|nr:hypothetical protein FGRMN_1115 [Fusarium graminum]